MTTRQATAIVDGWLKADSGRFDALALAYILEQMEETAEEDREDDDAAMFLTDFVSDNILADHPDYLHDMIDLAIESADYAQIASELLEANVNAD